MNVDCLVLDIGATTLSSSLNSQSSSSALSLVSQLSGALNANPLSAQPSTVNCSNSVTSTQQLRSDVRSQLLQSVASVVAQQTASTSLSVDTAAQVSQALAQIKNQPTEMSPVAVTEAVNLLQSTLTAAARGVLCFPAWF